MSQKIKWFAVGLALGIVNIASPSDGVVITAQHTSDTCPICAPGEAQGVGLCSERHTSSAARTILVMDTMTLGLTLVLFAPTLRTLADVCFNT